MIVSFIIIDHEYANGEPPTNITATDCSSMKPDNPTNVPSPLSIYSSRLNITVVPPSYESYFHIPL